MLELVPVEMSRYRIGAFSFYSLALRSVCVTRDAHDGATADGRVFFNVPKLFECSLCLQGGKKSDGWFFVHVEFLFNVGGDRTGMQGIPRLLSLP